MALVAALALVLAAGAAVAGDNPHTHGGFFIGFNLGAGSADVTIPGVEDTDREWGAAGNFRLGGAINDNLLLGAESSGWAKDEGGSSLSLGTLAFAVTYYPTDQGFFLKGAIGFASSSYETDLANGFTQSKTETGFGLQGAMGYEWRLTRKFAMGPQVEFVYLNIGGDLVDTANFFDATLGFNWYW
jgi:hypothetical protein